MEPSIATEWREIGQIKPYPGNPRVIGEDAVRQVAASIREFGWRSPIVVDEEGVILAGHTRRLAALRLGLDRVPVHVAAGLTPEQARAYRLVDNKVAEASGWDGAALGLELAALGDMDFGLGEFGFSGIDPASLGDSASGDAAEPDAPGKATGQLRERFGVAPFSVLNAREGWWQDRKRAWIDLGIRSELGRGEGATYGVADGVTEPGLNHYRNRNSAAPGGSPRPLDRGWTGKKDKTANA